ncbi:hypothetical protein DR046_02455 [Jannaschia formosa]|nr:hypothetical protein DR046_02455 [Jannaschia formosa]
MAWAAALACAACQAEELPEISVFRPDYLGVETRLLDPRLVNLIARMDGARDGQDVTDYARCAAAQYALIRGFGFARHVRTSLAERGGVWSADAVYTVSPDLPRGVRTIDAEVVVEDCRNRGIPTI